MGLDLEIGSWLGLSLGRCLAEQLGLFDRRNTCTDGKKRGERELKKRVVSQRPGSRWLQGHKKNRKFEKIK